MLTNYTTADSSGRRAARDDLTVAVEKMFARDERTRSFRFWLELLTECFRSGGEIDRLPEELRRAVWCALWTSHDELALRVACRTANAAFL